MCLSRICPTKYACCSVFVVMYSDHDHELRGSHVSPECYARLIFSMCVLCVCVLMPSVCVCVCVFLHAVLVCVNCACSSVVDSDSRKNENEMNAC